MTAKFCKSFRIICDSTMGLTFRCPPLDGTDYDRTVRNNDVIGHCFRGCETQFLSRSEIWKQIVGWNARLREISEQVAGEKCDCKNSVQKCFRVTNKCDCDCHRNEDTRWCECADVECEKIPNTYMCICECGCHKDQTTCSCKTKDCDRLCECTCHVSIDRKIEDLTEAINVFETILEKSRSEEIEMSYS